MKGQILRVLLPYRRALAAAGWTGRVVWDLRGAESIRWQAPDGRRYIQWHRRGEVLIHGVGRDDVTVHLRDPKVDAVHFVVDLAVRVRAILPAEVSNAALVAAARGGGTA